MNKFFNATKTCGCFITFIPVYCKALIKTLTSHLKKILVWPFLLFAASAAPTETAVAAAVEDTATAEAAADETAADAEAAIQYLQGAAIRPEMLRPQTGDFICILLPTDTAGTFRNKRCPPHGRPVGRLHPNRCLPLLPPQCSALYLLLPEHAWVPPG